jgi:thiazole/oxazole-forming peptide maturase SagC family component
MKKTAFRIKSFYTTIIHSPDEVELRSGIWNPISHFLRDDQKSGHLASIIHALNGEDDVKSMAQKLNVKRSEIESLLDHLNSIQVLEKGSSSAFDYYLNVAAPTFQHYHENPAHQTKRPILLLGDQCVTKPIQDLINKSFGENKISVEVLHDEEWKTELLREEDWLYDPLQLEKMRERFASWKGAFVVLATRHVEPLVASYLNRLAHELHFPWLHAAADGPFVLVGPLFAGGAGPCYDCFEKRVSMNMRDHAQYQKYKAAASQGQVFSKKAEGYEQVILHYLTSLTTMEVMNFYLTGCSFVKNKVHSTYLPSMEISFSEVLQLSNCVTCGTLLRRDEHQLYFESESLIEKQS